MGIFDPVIGETTKWLLRKVDKLLSKPKPTYQNKAEGLYEILCKIDDKISMLKETLFNPLKTNYNTVAMEDGLLKSNHYSDSALILLEINLWLKKTMEWYTDEYWYDIVLYSKRDKIFWDKLRQFLISFEGESNQFSKILSDFGIYYSLSGVDEHRSYRKERVNKKIETFNWDCDKILKKYIIALKDDISCYSIKDKKET